MAEFVDKVGRSISLRAVTPADREDLLAIYRDGRSAELDRVDWPEDLIRQFVVHQFDAQTGHYRQVYPNAVDSLILQDNIPVGRLYVDRSETQIAILDLMVKVHHRRHGIASGLIKTLQKEAALSGTRIRIFVESYNPAITLFYDLGFEKADSDDVNVRLEWCDR